MTTGGARSLRLTGGCLCGAVRYSVDDAFLYAVNCHCSNCRRTTGSAFKPFAGIGSERLELTDGADNILRYGGDEAHDVHCRTCGSFLYSMLDHGKRIHLAMGTLADAPSIRPSAHIFVGSKAPWYDITDDLPQFDGHAT
ncbi:MAG TPA: GFA family protein [Kaistia sp.]|nr:GFA family protein [Kaistia sp.]